jgi:DNA-3-methyladenine glycosylase I
MTRCAWVNPDNELYVHYHDEQWGVPVHDDALLFEMLILEGAQAGLSWETILKKRENYRAAYRDFDPVKVAAFTEKDTNRLLQDAGIVRNRLKIAASIRNAKVLLEIRKEFGSFDAYIWAFVQGKPIDHAFKAISEVPPKDALSDMISKDLKKRGMSFVGSTIIYSFMQAVGMVNDHTTDCFRHGKVGKARA